MASETIRLEVFRWHPEKGGEPEFRTYEVPFREDMAVLDALTHIKNTMDGTLTFRWSCRMGVCGSCGMMVNGVPKLTCGAFLRDFLPGPVRIEPLTNFPVERDLVVNIEDFMQKLARVKPYLLRKEEQPVEKGEYLQTPAELARFKQYSACINCLCCYAACPVYGEEERFLGPAAIALAQRYNLDSRDQYGRERRDIIFEDEAIWQCELVGECSAVCPKHVDPAGAIQRAKVEATTQFWMPFLHK